MGFLGAVFWEFIQNLPLIMSFAAAIWFWAQQSKRKKAVICILVGSVTGSLLIRFTEPSIHGYVEPLGVTIVNIVSMSVLMFAFTAYLGSETKWSNWKVDLILGGMAGVLLGAAQGLASPGAPIVGVAIHCLAFALPFPLALIGIRASKTKALPSALLSSVLITAAVTLAISLIDYSYFLLY
jgi:hypothetical protein